MENRRIKIFHLQVEKVVCDVDIDGEHLLLMEEGRVWSVWSSSFEFSLGEILRSPIFKRMRERCAVIDEIYKDTITAFDFSKDDLEVMGGIVREKKSHLDEKIRKITSELKRRRQMEVAA